MWTAPLGVALAWLVVLLLPAPAHALEATSPFVLDPILGPGDQFGYLPDYTRNVPAFDAEGRAYIRSRTSSANATSYVHTREEGSWTRLDFLTALRDAYPQFAGTEAGGGLRNDRIVFDRQDRAYNPITLKLRDGTRHNALLISWDHCRTWRVYKLPDGDFTTEHWVGHNELDGPPFLAFWRRSGSPDEPRSQRNWLSVTQPRLQGDELILPPLVRITDMCLGLSRDSGGSSFAVTRGDKTWFTWSEAAPRGVGGTSHYIATYDHLDGSATPPRRLAVSPRRSDPHNKPGICLDTAGYLHVIAGGHGSPALYTRSLAPLSADAGWTRPTPVLQTGWISPSDPAVQTGRQTYPAFVCDSEDTLHLITRQWRRGVDSYHDGAGYGALVHQSLPAGGAWSEPSLIVVGADPGYCIYYHKLALDARDRLFLSTSYQGGPDLRSERALTSTLAFLGRSRLRPGKYRRRMLLVSEDGGTSWRFATDADLDVPAAGERPAARSAQAASGPWDDRTAVVPNKLAWQWLNPQPQGNQFTGVAFGDRRSGWAVGTHGLVQHSSDGGVHWSPQAAGTTADLHGVAAPGADCAWAVGEAGTILRTTDGGGTWLRQASGTDSTLFGVCAVTTRIAWVVGARGILLHTGDGGRSWSKRRTAYSETLFGVDFEGRRRGFLCGANGLLLQTRDGGAHWKRRRTVTASTLFSIDTLADGHAVAVGADGVALASIDGGLAWRHVRSGIAGTLRAVRMHSSGRSWALGSDAVWRSTDFGRHWRRSRLPVPGPCGALAAITGRVVCAGGTGGALCRSGDGGATWRRLGGGHVKAIRAGVSSGDSIWMADAGGALIRAGISDERWASTTIAGGTPINGLARVGTRGWAVGDGGFAATTTDDGETWSPLQTPTTDDLTAVAAPAERTVAIAGEAGTLLTSHDAGASWVQHDDVADDLFCLSFVDSENGWAGGGAPFGETRAFVARTTDGGRSWSSIDLPAWGRVRGLSFLDPQNGWAVVEDWGADGDWPHGTVFATADAGETWVEQTTVSAQLRGVSMQADGSGLAFGERGCVLQTADAGVTWVLVDVGTDSDLYAVTSSARGPWLVGADGAVLEGQPPVLQDE